MHSLLLQYLVFWRPLGYLIIFLAMIVEGDIFLFTTGFLTHQGFFDPITAFVVVFFGAFMGDTLWFRLGAWMKNSKSRLSRWAMRAAAPFDDHLLNRPFHTIFFSKFIYGLHHPILIRAGALKLNFEKFFKDDIFSIIVWIMIVGGLGFFSSASFSLVKRYLRFAELGLFLGLVLFLFLWRFISKRSKKSL